MNEKVKQIRSGSNVITLASESRKVEGYALVFNSDSVDLGGFVERIEPTALEGVLERSDILALLDHNVERGVLARYRNGGGSMELEVDDIGLRYAFDAPSTALGDELLEGLRRGDISQSSFAFDIEGEKWEKRDDGTYLRTITQFGQLYDVSPVYHPAYPATSVDARGLEAFKAEEAAAKLVQERAKVELREYYEELRSKL